MHVKLKDLVQPFQSIFSFVLGGIIGGMIISFLFAKQFYFSRFIIGTFWSFTIWITQWLGHAYLAHLITVKFPWEKYKWKTIVFRVITIVVYSLVAFFIVQLLLMFLVNGSVSETDVRQVLYVFPYVLAISFLVSLVLATIEFYQNWRKTVLEHEKTKAQMMSYKYESLRNQINPHFLFNSLNVLSELVIEDQLLAVKFIRQLSLLYRYVLDSSQKELTTLSAEFEFIESYKFLLETRFEEGLNIILPNEKINRWIVPLSVQLLIENAVKHNVVSASNPLTVLINYSDDYLEVKNNFQPKEIASFSSGKGLDNIISRYKFFTEQPVIINQDANWFTVKIPLLEKT